MQTTVLIFLTTLSFSFVRFEAPIFLELHNYPVSWPLYWISGLLLFLGVTNMMIAMDRDTDRNSTIVHFITGIILVVLIPISGNVQWFPPYEVITPESIGVSLAMSAFLFTLLFIFFFTIVMLITGGLLWTVLKIAGKI